MKSPLFDRKHVLDYLLYGSAAGVTYAISVWYFLHKADYQWSWIVYLGTVLFMVVIGMYSLSLTRQQPDSRSAMTMVFAGHIAIGVGLVVAVVLSFILCWIYIPGFPQGRSTATFLEDVRPENNHRNVGTLFQVFVPGVLINFGAASFIALLIAYVIKPNQTKDKTLEFSEDPERLR